MKFNLHTSVTEVMMIGILNGNYNKIFSFKEVVTSDVRFFFKFLNFCIVFLPKHIQHCFC